NAKGKTPELVAALIREIYKAGGSPHVQLIDPAVSREIAMNCNEEQLKAMAAHEVALMEKMQGYIGIRAADNINEMADVPGDKLGMYSRLYELPVM
ncbi:hypothetical protein ACTGYV_11285, partial [Streptococcus suis]